MTCRICRNDFRYCKHEASPIRDGKCCDSCHSRFVNQGKNIVSNVHCNVEFEIIRNDMAMRVFNKRLSIGDFEEMSVYETDDIYVYRNLDTDEIVVACIM